MSFDRLIRFQTSDGSEKYGNLANEIPTREIEGTEVELLEGDVKSGFKKSGGKAKVGKLLCPLKREELNIILCVGLNYKRHAEECNVSLIHFVVLEQVMEGVEVFNAHHVVDEMYFES
jgi:transcription initiation factor TFIIH subunit 2